MKTTVQTYLNFFYVYAEMPEASHDSLIINLGMTAALWMIPVLIYVLKPRKSCIVLKFLLCK